MRRRRATDPGAATDRHRKVAQDYFSGQKSLEKAMGDNGFAPAYGRRGIANVARVSKPFREAFNEELDAPALQAEGADLSGDRIGKLMRWRIVTNLARGKDDASHSARLAGQLKDIDAYVREGGAVAGIFQALADPKAAALLDALDTTQCVWCRADFETQEHLQLHSGSCPERPEK